jgi:acyl-CoA thioesterase I
MQKLSLLFFLLFSLSAQAQNKIVIIGDSISEGYGVAKANSYPELLEKKILADGKKWDVINSSVSGSTSASAVSRMKWIIKSKPDVIFLALGGNDGLRGLTVKQLENNLGKAIKIAQAAKVKVILGGMYAPPNYGQKYSEDFRKTYDKLAKKYKIHLVPFILEKVGGVAKYNLSDGIHPNEEGHKIIAETIFQSIKDQL